MQKIVKEKETLGSFKINNLSLNDKQNLVGAFAWLIQEDKKQNPELYKLKNTKL